MYRESDSGVYRKKFGNLHQNKSISESNTRVIRKVMSRARKIVTKFHNYSYEIVMSPVIVNSYKNGHNS